MKFPKTVTLLLLSLFLHASAICSPRTIIIKISSRDCVLCNINLDNVYKFSGSTEKILILKNEEKEEAEFLATLHFDKRKNTRVYFSDSLYYKYDSTERSVFYLTEENNVKFKKYLKEINTQDLALFFGKETEVKKEGIKISLESTLINLGSKIGVINKTGNCYRIQKNNLSKIYDTIKLITPSIIEDIFKSTYGNRYSERMKNYKNILAMPDVRELPTVVNRSYFKDDTLYSIVTTYDGELLIENNEADTIVDIIALTNIVKFKDGKYLGTLALGGNKVINNEQYFLLPSMFFANHGRIYISVLKPKLSDYNPVFAEMKENGKKLDITTMAPIQLPEVNITSNMGYNGLGLVYSDRYIAFNTTSYIYDMSTFEKYNFPFYMQTNKMNKKEIEELTARISSMILSIHNENDELNVIYMSNDSVKHATCKTQDNKVELQKETLLSANSKIGRDYSYLIADKNGYYLYVKEKQAIEFFPY